eukprot:scaffold10314_cov55-Cyclotella_meneghiniana.AAC.3
MKHENGVALIQEIPSIIKHEGQETHSGILDDIHETCAKQESSSVVPAHKITDWRFVCLVQAQTHLRDKSSRMARYSHRLAGERQKRDGP